MERAERLKRMRSNAEAIYDRFSPLYLGLSASFHSPFHLSFSFACTSRALRSASGSPGISCTRWTSNSVTPSLWSQFAGR